MHHGRATLSSAHTSLSYQLRKINTASFPVAYSESFYQDVLKRNNENLNKFVYCNGFVVGALCARIESPPYPVGNTDSSSTTTKRQSARPKEEPKEDSPKRQRLYIMTLAVLAAYRGRGIGSSLVQGILDYAASNPLIEEIALHVQISNDDALRFYTRRFDFVQGPMVENYYRRIDPPHCYLLYKRISHEPPPPASQEDVGEAKAEGEAGKTS